MIAMWLVLDSRNTHTALEGTGIDGLCKDIVIMLIESRAPYPLRRELIVGPWTVECSEQCHSDILAHPRSSSCFPMTAIFGQIV